MDTSDFSEGVGPCTFTSFAVVDWVDAALGTWADVACGAAGVDASCVEEEEGDLEEEEGDVLEEEEEEGGCVVEEEDGDEQEGEVEVEEVEVELGDEDPDEEGTEEEDGLGLTSGASGVRTRIVQVGGEVARGKRRVDQDIAGKDEGRRSCFTNVRREPVV